jgi:putative sigma-54 modulation protein
MEVTNALKDYVEKRVGKIDKYFENLMEVQATLSVEKDRHIIEVTVPLDGIILRGEESTHDMYSSIDKVVDKIEKQIEKYRTKINRRLKDTSIRTNFESFDIDKDENNGARIVKTKRFAFKPMPVEEAVLQMNLLGHDFFVFSNADTDEVNVVYKRKDGNYGLIEPEF